MKNRNRKVEGVILELLCANCGVASYHFEFVGDQDGITDGLCSASRCGVKEIFLIEANADEWNNYEKDGISNIEQRMRKLYLRPDIRILRLIRYEYSGATGRGLSFQDFKKVSRRPRPVYACPCCSIGECKQIAELGIEEFCDGGGLIALDKDLQL